MGIVYNSKIGKGYINTPVCQQAISWQQVTKQLTRQNIQFLKSLGLKLINQKNNGNVKKTVKKFTKVTCIFICCCHLKPEENGGSP